MLEGRRRLDPATRSGSATAASPSRRSGPASFSRDFWIADPGYFALALDGSKRKVDAAASNMGHLLWSGIVDDDKAPAVVRRLFRDELWTGWGIRTLATDV